MATDTTQLVQIQSQPPWLAMPANGEPFNQVGYVALPAIGAEANIFTFQVPEGRHGIIKWIGNNFVGGGWVEGSGNVLWRIEVDGVAVRNHEAIASSLGNPASPSETAPIRLHEGQIVTLIVRNVGVVVAGQLVGGRLSGWFYPVSDEVEEVWL